MRILNIARCCKFLYSFVIMPLSPCDGKATKGWNKSEDLPWLFLYDIASGIRSGMQQIWHCIVRVFCISSFSSPGNGCIIRSFQSYRLMKRGLLLAGFIAGTFFAQAQEKQQALDEIVVTATKFDKRQSEAGQAITVIDSAEIAHSYGQSLAQLLAAQHNIVINGSGSNPAKDKSLYLRGAGAEYTLILIDGVPVSDPSGVGGTFDLRLIPVDQIQRIEILPGGQSTLYGSDAVAGVINIITRKGSPYAVAASGSVSAGSYGSFKQNIALNGDYQGFRYNISYTHDQADGISEATDSTGKGDFDKDGFGVHNVDARFGFKLAPKWDLQPFFRFADYHSGYDDGSFLDGLDTFYSKNYQAGVSSTYEIENGALHANYSFEDVHRDYKSSFPSSYDGSLSYLDLYVNKNFGDHFQWLSGISNSRTDMEADGVSADSAFSDLFGVYGSAFLRDLKGFNLALGGRFNHHNVYGNNLTFTVNPSFNIKDRYEIFANISSAFRTPTLSMLYGQYGPNLDLKPEQSKNYEAGISISPFAGKNVRARATFFKRDIRDVIIYTDRYMNFNKQDDQGIETELSYEGDHFHIKAFYTYTDGKVTTQNNGKDSSYYNLLRRPRNAFGISGGYQGKHFYVDINLRSYGERSDIGFDANFAQVEEALKAYTLLDAYAEYAFFADRLKVFADAKNLLNTRYAEAYGYNTMGFNIRAGLGFNLHR